MGGVIQVYELDGISIVLSQGGESLNGGEPTTRRDWRTEYYTVPFPVVSMESVRAYEAVIGYVSEAGESMTPAEHATEREKLRENLIDPEEDEWASLEDEFAYRKFCERWKPIKESRVDRTPVEFTVTKLAYDAKDLPPYCVPCRLEGAAPTAKSFALFRYAPDRLALLIETAEREGFRYGGEKSREAWEFGIPSHGVKDYRFITIAGNYGLDPENRIRVAGMVGTLQECRDRHDANLASLRRFWREEAAKMAPKPLDRASAGALLGMAQRLVTEIGRIQSVKSTRSNQSTARKLADDLLNGISQAAVPPTPRESTSPTTLGESHE